MNANGAGPRASITFTSLDDGPPNEPVELVAVGGFRRVALSWETPASTFSRIGYYQVRHRSGEQPYTSWTRIPNSNHRTTSHTLTGLADETPYDIQVRGVNSEGVGASAQRRATTQALPVDAPSDFTATAGIRKVDLAWTAAASTVAVEAYQYRLSTDAGDTWNSWTDIAESGAKTTRHTVSGLANGTAYEVELRIRADTARSAAAVSQSATTPDVPSAPVLSAKSGDASITLTWTAPHEGGRAITKYEYRRSRQSPGFTPWDKIPGSGPNTKNYTVTDGLLEGWKHTFEVRAVNAVGNGRAGSVAATTAVSGDPTIRTWRAFGVEGRHATVDFPVQLHPAASSTVTVDYRTEDNTATAPADYRATNGTLTFARGETEKTVSVPIVDDTVEDSGEWFWLRLSNVSGALLGDEYAGGWIYNHEDVVAGFTLVDAASGTDVGSLVDGTEVTLADPANGQYGVRVETLPEAAIGSLRLKLSGAKAVTRTDNVAPYTLYSAGGEGLPPGAYTLQATAYPAAEGEAGEAPRAADALGIVHGDGGGGGVGGTGAADGVVRERAGGARRQQQVLVPGRVQRGHRHQLRDDAGRRLRGRRRRRDRGAAGGRAARPVGDHGRARLARGGNDHAERRPRLRHDRRRVHAWGRPKAAEQQPVGHRGRAGQ